MLDSHGPPQRGPGWSRKIRRSDTRLRRRLDRLGVDGIGIDRDAGNGGSFGLQLQHERRNYRLATPRRGAVRAYQWGEHHIDSDNDRLIAFGGGADDLPEPLTLSGPHQGEWAQIAKAGPHPPVHAYDAINPDSAVYDPIGKRMIVLENPWPITGGPVKDLPLWQLSLSGEPTWSEIYRGRPIAGRGDQSARIVYDPKKNRLLSFGGALSDAGVWALSLGATPTWSRLGGAPPDRPDVFYSGHSLILDSEGEQPHPLWRHSLR